ncbi:MAG TPA: replication-relaxation family protein [Solirubrobacterales bacterium]|nr:replication-relaxation family protein [Solirubrobacterales bacterium]
MSSCTGASREAGGVEILESLGQHRLLSTRQIHELHTSGSSIRWAQDLLGRLCVDGLALPTTMPGGRFAWHITETGADVLEEVPNPAEERRPVVTPEKAASPPQVHTLAVNEVGLAFVRAARGWAGTNAARSTGSTRSPTCSVRRRDAARRSS